MEMQARYDAAQARQKDAPVNTKAYVPPFLSIKANDIDDWVSHNIPARSRLAGFLAHLSALDGQGAHESRLSRQRRCRAPRMGRLHRGERGNAVGSRSGAPAGSSAPTKTESQGRGRFRKEREGVDKKEREKTTFVFVTPRRWHGKFAWVAAKQAKELWKDVRAYDASDLEQWVEQSLPGQAWFANERHIPAQDVRSLDKCWADWANVATPPLTGALFNSAIEATKRTMLSRLSKPSEGPIVIAADSTDEALAFLAQLFGRAERRRTGLVSRSCAGV